MPENGGPERVADKQKLSGGGSRARKDHIGMYGV